MRKPNLTPSRPTPGLPSRTALRPFREGLGYGGMLAINPSLRPSALLTVNFLPGGTDFIMRMRVALPQNVQSSHAMLAASGGSQVAVGVSPRKPRQNPSSSPVRGGSRIRGGSVVCRP